MRKFLFLLHFLFLSSLSLAMEPFREWTNLDGRAIKARFIEEIQGQVSVRRSDGRTFKIQLDQLSKEDRKYVMSLSFDPTVGLVAWFPFNGNAGDESGNGHHGKVFGATLCKDRKGNNDSAYNFDGINDYIDLGKSPKLNPRNQMTITYWFMIPRKLRTQKGDHLVAGEPIIERYQPNLGRRSYFTGILADRTPTSYFYQDGGKPDGGRGIGTDKTEPLKLNKHYFLVVSFDHSKWGYLFLNGQVISDLNYGDPIQQTKESTTIGGVVNTKTKYFTGVVDDVRLYNRALSKDEVESLYELEK